MTGKAKRTAGDELSVAGFVVGLLVVVPGAMVLAIPPLLAAPGRLGNLGTALLVLGFVALAIAFFPAYERLKPSSPPTPRRDFVVILFSALLAGLWTYLFFDVLLAFLLLVVLGGIVLLPEDWGQRVTEHLPGRHTGA